MKTTLALLSLFLIVLVGGYLYSTHKSNSYAPVAYTKAASASTSATNAVGTPPSSAVTPTSSASTETPPITSHSDYSLAVVASHNNSNSCWTAINGNVYDLTKWISQHPGGQGRILSICGKDGSSAFDGQHGGDPRALSILATFKIGTLSS